LAATIEKKFLSGAAMSLQPTTLPRRSAMDAMPPSCFANSRMQPPWVAVLIFTSKPCSRGFSQRNAMPTPASALPVLIASSS